METFESKLIEVNKEIDEIRLDNDLDIIQLKRLVRERSVLEKKIEIIDASK